MRSTTAIAMVVTIGATRVRIMATEVAILVVTEEAGAVDRLDDLMVFACVQGSERALLAT
jgi:hypothetical protein|tara:strand:- start:592 stop:771 length:180 start_codon:yes stop_codon:yes gene_type:complete